MPKGIWKPLTADEEQFIESNYLDLPIKRIAQQTGISFGRVMRHLAKKELEIPNELIEQRKRASQLQPGNISYNKGKKQSEYMTPEAIERTKATRFKKGHSPHNEKFDGHERITKDGYTEVRISKGKYRLKHLYEWEKINGKLPKSHVLLCVDGNKLNIDPTNWKLATRAENMLRNSKHKFSGAVIPSMVLVNKIKNQIKKHENGENE